MSLLFLDNSTSTAARFEVGEQTFQQPPRRPKPRGWLAAYIQMTLLEGLDIQ